MHKYLNRIFLVSKNAVKEKKVNEMAEAVGSRVCERGHECKIVGNTAVVR